MSRLPIPGQDDGTWGTILNDFLGVSFTSNGTLDPDAIITAGGYLKPITGIPTTDLNAAIQTSLGKADTALQSAPVTSVAGRGGAVILTESDIASLSSDLAATEKSANKGVPFGYTPLDSSSKVPVSNLPIGTTSTTVAVGNDVRFNNVGVGNTVVALGTISGSISCDLSQGFAFTATLNGNTTFNFINWPSGAVLAEPILYVVQDSTGGRTITVTGVTWEPNNVAPSWATSVGALNVIPLSSPDNGAHIYGQTNNFTGISASILTSLGDMIASDVNGNATRLAVGTNGQTLIADSTQTLGVKWGTPTQTYTAPVTINTAADTTKGLIVQANSATQSADLQEWRTNTGSNLLAVQSSGILSSTLASIGVAIRAGLNSDAHARIQIDNSGEIELGSGTVNTDTFLTRSAAGVLNVQNAVGVSGLTGATAASRYVGATTGGAPASGTFIVGDAAIDQTGKLWICTTAGTPGTWTATNGQPVGLTGAAAATRYAGGTTSGAPTTGTFVVGDFVIDQTGKVWVCTTAGTPGTWTVTNANLVAPVNISTGSDTNKGLVITANSATQSVDLQEWHSSAGITLLAVNSTGILTTSPVSAGAATFRASVSGDAHTRFQIDNTGEIEWGSGTATTDTFLTRSAAGVLNIQSAVGVSGLSGATAPTRYVGGTASGAPSSGTFAVGDFVIDQTGQVWICTVAGTPGTWTSPSGSVSAASFEPGGANDLYLYQGNIASDHLETIPAIYCSSSSSLTSGDVAFAYFTAPYGLTIANLVTVASTQVQTGATLIRFGLYTVDGSGNLTLVARTVDGHSTSWASTTALSSLALDATFNAGGTYAIIRGQRYAFAVLGVGMSTSAKLLGMFQTSSAATNFAKVRTGHVGSQTDLATSYTVGSLSTGFAAYYWGGMN